MGWCPTRTLTIFWCGCFCTDRKLSHDALTCIIMKDRKTESDATAHTNVNIPVGGVSDE